MQALAFTLMRKQRLTSTFCITIITIRPFCPCLKGGKYTNCQRQRRDFPLVQVMAVLLKPSSCAVPPARPHLPPCLCQHHGVATKATQVQHISRMTAKGDGASELCYWHTRACLCSNSAALASATVGEKRTWGVHNLPPASKETRQDSLTCWQGGRRGVCFFLRPTKWAGMGRHSTVSGWAAGS